MIIKIRKKSKKYQALAMKLSSKNILIVEVKYDFLSDLTERCEKCGIKDHIKNWTFYCHSTCASYKISSLQFSYAISTFV